MSKEIEKMGKKVKSEKRLATDYLKGSGFNNFVNFKGGKVFVGGKEMKDVYIDADNKAHVDKEELDSAIEQSKRDMGIKEGVYDQRIEDTIFDIESTGEWQYNPEKDSAYKAYRDKYQREGKLAFEDAYAKMSALSGGYESSAAVTAAAQQLNLYNDKLNEKTAELMEISYKRYQDGVTNKREHLSSLLEAQKLQNEANNDIYQRYNDAQEADMERTIYEAYTRHKNALDLENDEKGLDIAKQSEDIRRAKIQNAYDAACIRGYFTPEEAQILGIEKNSRGEYPSPFSGEVKREIELWNSIGKEKESYKTNEAIRKAWAT